MAENFCIAAFRSRQQVMAFERLMAFQGLKGSVMTTPRAVSMGCGLSVRFEMKDLGKVRLLARQVQPGSLIGLYGVTRDGTGRTTVRVL